jgi:hypothetical protein
VPQTAPANLVIRMKRYAHGLGSSARSDESIEEVKATSKQAAPTALSFDLSNPPAEELKLEFSGLTASQTIWIYEFNVISDDWGW